MNGIIVINKEKEDQQQQSADNDAAVRKIENWKIDQPEIQEIDDMTQPHPVDHVADAPRR